MLVINVLKDLGYTTNNTYGTESLTISNQANPYYILNNNFRNETVNVTQDDNGCYNGLFVPQSQIPEINICDNGPYFISSDFLLNNDNFTESVTIAAIEVERDLGTITPTSEGFNISSTYQGRNIIIRYITINSEDILSNVSRIAIFLLPCNDFQENFGCSNTSDCNLICNSELTSIQPCDYTFFVDNVYYGIEGPGFPSDVNCGNGNASVPSWYTYTYNAEFIGNPSVYNSFYQTEYQIPLGGYMSLSSYTAGEGAGVMTKVNTLESDKNYILSIFGYRPPFNGNFNAELNVKLASFSDTNYPYGIHSGQQPTDFQNILTQNYPNTDSSGWKQSIQSFTTEPNNTYDILVFQSVLKTVYFDQAELIEDKLNADNIATSLNCSSAKLSLGTDLCDITGLVYSWHDVTGGGEIQLTNGISITNAGLSAGITTQDLSSNGSQLDILVETEKTFELRRTFINSWVGTNEMPIVSNDANASIQINVSCEDIDTTSHFITTWQVDNFDTFITIPTHPSETYSYDVDWEGDGIFDDFGVTGDITHDYGIAGTYEVHIRGDFPHIYFGHTLYNFTPEILEVNQWGSQIWTSMNGAFTYCSNLIITAIDTPNLSNVTDMTKMFHMASSLNQPLNNWDVSNVTNMRLMFNGATSFNQPLNNWDVSNVTDMVGMFGSGSSGSFNQPLNNWNVSNVSNMVGMFSGATSFNQLLNNWDVSNVTNMRLMFNGALNFNQPLNNWDVSNVTDMARMFENSTSFNQSLNNWNVSNVNVMSEMFENATSFNQPLNNWNVSNVYSMYEMFSSATSFNQPLGDWDISNVGSYYDMLNNTNLTTANYDNLLIGWNQLPNLPQSVNINLGFINSTYCTGAAARQNLISTYYWTLNDEGLSPGCRIANRPANPEQHNIKIYPNPTASIFNIEFINQSVLSFNVIVQNMFGLSMLEFKDKKEINISDLNTGMYFIKITTNTGEIYLSRIVKK